MTASKKTTAEAFAELEAALRALGSAYLEAFRIPALVEWLSRRLT